MWRYVGDGAWLPGVPARDLTAVEFERHQEAIEAAAAAGHVLYVAEPDAKVGKFVTAVPGIGAKTAAALAAAEIVTVEDLVAADALFIDAALDGVLDYVTVDKVRQWQADAAALVAQAGEGEPN
jgi:hypothetical protein